jgi:4-hydroxy-2-oxoheptanedioate aldolase
MKTNAMKQKLVAGKPVFGMSMMIPSPQVVEMAAELGFDWVLLDCEHGTLSLESVELLCMAADAHGITPIARPAVNAHEAIAPLLDRGAMGVQVPHVNNGEDARRAVEAVKFYPHGKRGMAAGTRPSQYGLSGSVAAYAEQANRETLVCVQLEEFAAIQNADEILGVDGVDVFFVGPSDLSQSMGFIGRPDAPEVKSAIDATLAKIVTAGKIPGMPGTNQSVATIREQGALYIYTHLPVLLARGAQEFFLAAEGGNTA